MSWKEILKEDVGLLSKLEGKEKKRLKKVLQSAQPTEYFGQDLTKLSNLISCFLLIIFLVIVS